MKKVRVFTFIFLGVVSIILSIRCYAFDVASGKDDYIYGGDAYTGIQNAAAATSRNVSELTNVIKFGFGSLLLVGGLTFIGIALTTPLPGKSEHTTATTEMTETKDIDAKEEASVNDETKES